SVHPVRESGDVLIQSGLPGRSPDLIGRQVRRTGDVLVDRAWQEVRLLKDHTQLLADGVDVERCGILAVIADRADRISDDLPDPQGPTTVRRSVVSEGPTMPLRIAGNWPRMGPLL